MDRILERVDANLAFEVKDMDTAYSFLEFDDNGPDSDDKDVVVAC